MLDTTSLAAENLRNSLECAHACQQPDLQVEALRCLALTAAANGDVSEATSYPPPTPLHRRRMCACTLSSCRRYCEVAIQFGLQVEDKSKLAECEYVAWSVMHPCS